VGCLGSENNNVIKIHMDVLVIELRKCRAVVSCCPNKLFVQSHCYLFRFTCTSAFDM
jgi:hypothetical protein